MSDDFDRKRLYPILLIIFINILGAGVILPILPLYAEGHFAGTILQVTLLSTAYFAAQFIAAPILGRLSDRYGRRPVLIASQIGTVVAFVLFIFAAELGQIVEQALPSLPMTGGMFMLYIARIVDGITGGNITTAQAYIADITPDEHRAEGLGLLQAAFGVGFIFGPAFGGVLASYGSRMPFIGAVVITTITLIVTMLILKESLPPEERGEDPKAKEEKLRLPAKELLAQPAFLLLIGVGFFATLAFSSQPATFALFADSVLFHNSADPQRVQMYIGIMLTFSGIFTVLTQAFALKPVTARLGDRSTMLVGTIFLTGAFVLLSFARSAVVATILMAPNAFGRGISDPPMQAIVTRFGNERTRGQLLGVFQSTRSLALILGPVWAGYVFEAISPPAVYLVAGALALVAVFMAVLLMGQTLPAMQPRPAQATSQD